MFQFFCAALEILQALLFLALSLTRAIPKSLTGLFIATAFFLLNHAFIELRISNETKFDRHGGRVGRNGMATTCAGGIKMKVGR